MQSNKIELLYVDPAGDGEISISNQNDFNEILTEIEELKGKGNTNKPVIIVKSQDKNQHLAPTKLATDLRSVASTVCIDPVQPSELGTVDQTSRNTGSDKNSNDQT